MNEKIRALVMRPKEEAEEVWILPTNDVLKKIVGGDIKMRNPLSDGTVIICKHEDVDHYPVANRVLRNSRGHIVSSFYGPIVVAGLFLEAGELDSLTDMEINMALNRLERMD